MESGTKRTEMRKEKPNPDFISIEHEMLKFWKDEKCFEKLVEQNANGERFRFLDGPITANNAMGIHHAWGRTLKDLMMRFNAMRGKSCQYQNGFDAQGLWVEVEIEKELGLNGKKGIVEYGMDRFTEKCMARVAKFSEVITEQSVRLGQWMDWKNSYYTNTDLNITSIWHFLKTCRERGYLVRSHRPMPWCPRCGTSLSEHEMTGSYRNVKHLSIYAKLPILGTNDRIAVWTTTPWTLTSNVALAVNPDITYVRAKIKSDDRPLIAAKTRLCALKGDVEAVLGEFKGSELVGKEYETIFPEFAVQRFRHFIVPWDAVDASEGTGAVHIAPGCGAEDFELGKKFDLPQICPIDDAGTIVDGFGELTGSETGAASEPIAEMMRRSNKLYKTETIEHSYPFCWRCKHEVVFKLVDEWSIATDEIRPDLIRAAESVEWDPPASGKRMLDWLNNMGDWNISRKRFYGLPLPFYPCARCGHLTVVGSKEELASLAEPGALDGVPHLHRPYIDKVKIRCPKCGAPVERVPEVGDCWLDAGITPFSTKKYFEDREYFNANFPSEIVVEMSEQIRLWFYSLLFMSVVLTGKAPYEKVFTHSSVVQEDGSKFSKTGKMIAFGEAAEKMGADTIRYLYCSSPVNCDVRFGCALADEARRKILSFWNIYAFFNLYACLDKPDISGRSLDGLKLSHSDKWLLARTDALAESATDAMLEYRPDAVVREFESFCDDVSNWYVRINRKRFWKSSDKADQAAAYRCLYEAIKTAAGVMAPIMPFLTDRIYQNTVRVAEPDAPISVHLTRYPVGGRFAHFRRALSETALARRLITTVQRMRNEARIRVKQPLAALCATVSESDRAAISPLLDVIRDELNVKEILFVDRSEYLENRYSVNFRAAGARLKKDAQRLKSLVDGLDRAGMRDLDAMYLRGRIDLGEFVGLDCDLFERHSCPKPGYVVGEDSAFCVALDTRLTPELIEEGFVRELIRKIQVMRKDAGFSVERRIRAKILCSDPEGADVIARRSAKICEDILCVELCDVDGHSEKCELCGHKLEISLKPV